MTNYATEPLETLNTDLNAAVAGVNSLSGYAKVDDLSAYASQTDLGDIDAVLDAVGGTDDFKIQLIERTITSVSANDLKGMTKIGDGAFYSCSELISIIIPETVTLIGANAFYVCSNLSSVVLPSTITTIKNNAFNNCSKISSIVIPDAVTSIENNAFAWCRSLTTVDFGTTRSTIPTIGNFNVFSNFTSDFKIYVPSNLVSTWKTTGNWTQYESYIEAHP